MVNPFVVHVLVIVHYSVTHNKLGSHFTRTQGVLSIQGFSLHANVRCEAEERKKLEKLCRYVARPALANEQLKLTDCGQVVLTLKTPC